MLVSEHDEVEQEVTLKWADTTAEDFIWRYTDAIYNLCVEDFIQ